MTDGQQRQPTPESRPFYRRWWFIALAIVVVLAALGSLAGDEGATDGEPVAAETTTTATQSPETTTTTEPATTTTTQPPTTTTTQPTTTTTAAPVPNPEPWTFSGSGSEVVEFEDDLVSWLSENVGVFEYSVSGSGLNLIWSLDASFEESNLLVNTVGPQEGIRWISLTDDSVGLSVDVDGGWEFAISPLTTISPAQTAADANVRVLDTTGSISGAEVSSVSGRAPDAIALRTEDRVAEVTASGDGLIIIWVYSNSGDSELVVNEIDSFDGSGLLPDCSSICLVDLDGEFEYTLTIRES